MAKTRINVRVDPELWEAVHQAVRDGRFPDATAAIEEGLRKVLGKRPPKRSAAPRKSERPERKRPGPDPELVRETMNGVAAKPKAAPRRAVSPRLAKGGVKPIPKGGKR